MGRLNQSRRQTIGYVYKPMVNNNIKDVQTGRVMSSVQDQAFDYNTRAHGAMSGDGFADMVRGIFDKGLKPAASAAASGAKYLWDNKKAIAEGARTVADAASSVYTSELGTALRNAIPDSDDTARPGFAGEKHMILKLKNGKNGVANYMGPGTEVVKRVKRGDPGRTPADMVAKRHDIDYALAQGQPTKAKQLQAVREADNRMIRTLKSIASGKQDANRNIQVGMRLIQAKTIGEDLGLLDKSKFAGDLAKVSDKDKVLLMSNRAKLTQEGYGIGVGGNKAPPLLPGDELKMKLLKKMVREKKMKALGDRVKTSTFRTFSGHQKSAKQKSAINKNKGASYLPAAVRSTNASKTLPGMKAYKLRMSKGGIGGSGMVMGMERHIMGFVMNAVPNLIKTLGIDPKALPIKKIVPMVGQALKMAPSGNLSSIIKNLTKTLLPLLAHGKLKTLGQAMSGKEIMDLLKSANGLDKKLASGLFNAFKWYLNKNGLKPVFTGRGKGSGVNLPGGSWDNFWKGVKEGFKMVFKPGAKLLAYGYGSS